MKNKMMKNYFISLLALLFTCIACDDEALNLNDPGSGTMEGFFTGEETLLMGVAGAVSYTHLTLPTNREV